MTDDHAALRPLHIVTLLAALSQILTPLLPMIGIGESVGTQSDGVRTLITPAGWAFVIWGPLYFGTILFAIYQLLPAGRGSALVQRLGYHPAMAFIGNAVWVAYTQVYGLAFPSVLIILFTLINLLAVLRAFTIAPTYSAGERGLVLLPLSALAGWLTAATIVNIAAALNFHGITLPGSAPAISAAILLVGAGIVSLAVVRTGGNPWYPIPYLWALWAIHQQGGQQFAIVATAAIVASGIVLATLIAMLLKADTRRRYLG